MVAHTSRSAVRVVEDLGYLPEVRCVIRVGRRVADGHRLAPTQQLELLPVALGEAHLELIALDEDHQVCVAVGSRIAAGMRAEQDDPPRRRIRRKLINERWIASFIRRTYLPRRLRPASGSLRHLGLSAVASHAARSTLGTRPWVVAF